MAISAKFTVEDLKAAGFESEKDFLSTVAQFKTAAATFASKEDLKALEDLGDVSALANRVDALEKKPAPVAQVDEAKVKEIATLAASTTANEIIAKTGPKGADNNPLTNETNTDPAKALIAAGDYIGAWKASKDIQGAWEKPEVYAAYMRAEANGQVRHFTK